MNNQIVEISCEELDLVSGGIEWKEGAQNFGKGLVKPFGFFNDGTEIFDYEKIGDCSLNGNGKMGAISTAITDTVIVSGLMAAGMAAGATVMYFVKDKVKSLLSK